jgi:hypothetical protein
MVHLVLLLALADPFVGTWKLRAENNPRLESMVITVTATDVGHKWSYDIGMKGAPKHVKYAILTDRKAGKFKMVAEDGKVMGEGKLIIKGPTEWEIDAPDHKSHGSISADGKVMTVNTTAPMAATHVLDKQ